MTDWTSLSVTEEQKEVLEEAKPEGMTMGVFLVKSITDDIETHSNADVAIDTNEIVAELEQAIDSMAFSGAISDEKADEILGRLDDIESNIPAKTAQEVLDQQ
jgi:hypothetical protein